MAGQPGRSGGRRQGRPGTAYPNRSDLQAPKAAPGQEYGQQAAQLRGQKVMPLPQGPPASSNTVSPMAAAPMAQAPAVLAPTPLSAPTERPNEPVTAGLPFGPGPGPSAIPQMAPLEDHGFGQAPSNPVEWLRAIYSVAPNNDLLDVMNHLTG
jgi:hypothetical protein